MFFEWKQRMIKLALLCALRHILAIWSENFISLSIVTPKSTACSTGSILWSFIVNSRTGREWCMPSDNTQHLEYDIGSCQISAHVTSLSSCSCKSVAVSNELVFILEYSLTSSAYSFRVTTSVITSGRSLINSTNKIGPRQLPRTTPQVIYARSDRSSPTFVGMINRTFVYKDKEVMLRLYQTLVRPELEYSV